MFKFLKEKYNEYKQKRVLTNLDKYTVNYYSLNGVYTPCIVVDVYDGDTCTIILVDNHNTPYRYKVRMEGYDSPEMKPPLKDPNRHIEIKKAKDAKKRLVELVDMENNTIIYIKCGKYDKYGRLLGKLYRNKRDMVSINNRMINEGHGYPYDGGTKNKI